MLFCKATLQAECKKYSYFMYLERRPKFIAPHKLCLIEGGRSKHPFINLLKTHCCVRRPRWIFAALFARVGWHRMSDSFFFIWESDQSRLDLIALNWIMIWKLILLLTNCCSNMENDTDMMDMETVRETNLNIPWPNFLAIHWQSV